MAFSKQEAAFAEAVLGSDPMDATIAWIAKNLKPEDVFSERVLENWATQNGFIEPEDE